MLTIEDVYAARDALSGVLRPTALLESGLTSSCRLFLKPENRQRTGSFKIRGAYNKMAGLSAEQLQKGILACSAGNHAQGVAYAARQRNAKAVICMPAGAPTVKVRATEALGAEVVLVPGVYDDAYQKALELQKEYGYMFIHPFNDEAVMAGQGTLALEILEEQPDTDAIVCAVGGGGLISGVAVAAKALRPDIKIYGVQSDGALGMYASMALGYVNRLDHAQTVADGIAVREVGNRTLQYVEQYVDDVFHVSEAQIKDAICRLICGEKLVAEGAGAAPVAAVLRGCIPQMTPDKNVVCILSGGNIDRAFLTKLLSEAKEE